MIFSNIKERIWRKIQGWKEKLLSKPGKEVLIKAIAQSIPTYVMSLFHIPTGIIDDIHSALAKFWWGSTETTRRMHWMNWHRLGSPKSQGGMGFRDLKIFNQAFLAKQGWHLVHHSESLVGKVLKAKYFKDKNFVEAYLDGAPSYTWRSIWGVKALLVEGLKWRVGDGRSIGGLGYCLVV